MTDSEALKLMESLQISHDCEMVKTLDFKGTVIKALEDLQQYRELGTVEQIRFMQSVCDMSDDMLKSLADSIRARMKYEAIGTVEEFKALKDAEKEIRAKAIDEFAEKLNTDVESFEAEVDGVRADLLTLDYFSEFVFDVAEQMKGEQNG